ncbi:MAG: PDDEXK nuclease domain-containing protein [Synergistaceae bacterium]|jgi:predicted nuclease of restriction endonuclease-like (RecB) superfamily|nr:PDDEXK nuclease domain-containing protein [Synergistaceae bacterium]
MCEKKKNARKSMGAPVNGVVIPVAPNSLDMPKSYGDLRDSIINRIKDTRFKVLYHANAEKNLMYWQIGNDILRKQENEGWGAKVIDRLSKDLKEAFPDMSGFSPRNLKYMRKFAESWTNEEIVQQVVAQIQWRSIITLIDKLNENESRLWYAQKALKHGWSSNILSIMVEARLIDREGKAVTNFNDTLPSSDSDMAVQSFKDPYLFDFLGTGDRRREAEVERELVAHIEKFLLELGQGFAFVGRQVHLEVGGDDFYIDLLFYHLKLRCYVAIELKARDFEPGDVAQLNMYQNIVNKALRHPDDKPTIGLLLVKGKNKIVVEYSLMSYTNPIGVADWQTQLTREIPEDLKTDLPTVEEIERELDDVNCATTAAQLKTTSIGGEAE